MSEGQRGLNVSLTSNLNFSTCMSHKTFGPGARVLLVGATSGIAIELAREFARHGFNLILAARDADELNRIAADARIRGANVETRDFNALDYDSHAQFWANCGDVDGVICCFGVLPDEQKARADWAICGDLLEVNYNANVSLLNLVANSFEQRGRGFIGVLSSVAGRPRQTRQLFVWQRQSGPERLRRRFEVAPVSRWRNRDDDKTRPG